MIKIKSGRFETFDPNSNLFYQLKTNPPIWWSNLIEDKELYIEIRKDNYINIYYFGGCIARVEYKKDYKITTHKKYLKQEDKRTYIDCSKNISTPNGIAELKKNVRSIFLNLDADFKDIKPTNGILNSSEKFMQGYLILKDRQKYIDSEFAYNAAEDKIKRRIDLVRLNKGEISFVEVKRINDGRFTSLTKCKSKVEVVDQMNKYQTFIETYKTEILKYYRDIVKVKTDIGILSSTPEINTINDTPILLIVNNYDSSYKSGKTQRAKRIDKINELIAPYRTENVSYNELLCK